ncbi:MAG: bifunctional 4-hydroxy-2-oxoglutarate aldolase/2-dehydro-3-deoxy-phosphogluconate aldolase [Actinobacteria bacterium]|nr:bifunctional 4-hydroxy-2-oxoglutarate aldolase/2-dehydro-3-deoxy-phosphogluconate aldolase [Actinomycetota bacterium]
MLFPKIMATSKTILKVTRVIPVIVIDDYRHALPLGNALVAAGLPVAEVTLRTADSWKAVEQMLSIKDLEVGVGSVKGADDLIKAKELGASFAVSPGITSELALSARKNNFSLIPGVSTPSEVMVALSYGFSILKWFPAESLGGITSLKALSAPFPGIKFIPTGGITMENALGYLALDCVSAIGGSWMVSREKLKNEKFDEIESDVRAAVSLVRRQA